jgi:hypothetical protein
MFQNRRDREIAVSLLPGMRSFDWLLCSTKPNVSPVAFTKWFVVPRMIKPGEIIFADTRAERRSRTRAQLFQIGDECKLTLI